MFFYLLAHCSQVSWGIKDSLGGVQHHEAAGQAEVEHVEMESIRSKRRLKKKVDDGQEFNLVMFSGATRLKFCLKMIRLAVQWCAAWVKLLPTVMGVFSRAVPVLGVLQRELALPAAVSGRFKFLHTLFFRKWFFDEAYNACVCQKRDMCGPCFWTTE